MSGLPGIPVYLTDASLWLGQVDITKWTRAGSIHLRQEDDFSWSLDLSLTVIPVGADHIARDLNEADS